MQRNGGSLRFVPKAFAVDIRTMARLIESFWPHSSQIESRLERANRSGISLSQS